MKRLAFAFLAFTGCGGYHYDLAMTGTAPTAPSAATCDFKVVGLPPQVPFDEVATLTPEVTMFGAKAARDPLKFKSAVHDAVCKVGGDVVVTEVNGQGVYVRGTVLRLKQAAAITADVPAGPQI